MSGTRTLQRPYPKEKNPFHEDVLKSKNGVKRTFSILKESLRRSFRKKPEPQAKYDSNSNQKELANPKFMEPQEEFVIRTRIPDRCAHIMQTRYTVATTSATTATPVPPPRTSSMRKRNRLNSASSGCSTNPFDDDVTPLFPDAITASRHTLNIPQQCMYGSQSTLRTSCESINTIGHARRKKRDAPPPPNAIQPHDGGAAMSDSTSAQDVVIELQKIRCDIALMTEDLIQDSTFRDGSQDCDEIITKEDIKLDDDTVVETECVQFRNGESVASAHIESSQTVVIICDTIQNDAATVEPAEPDNLIFVKSSKDNALETCDKPIQSVELETRIPLRLEDAATNDNSDISVDSIEYVSSETIVLKRNVSRRETMDNRIPTPPIEFTTFQPIQKAKASEMEQIAQPKLSLVQRRKARFEANIAGEELSDEDDLNDNFAKQKEQTDKAVEVGVDVNSNELQDESVAITWEALKCDKAPIKYIDDDRDDILEYQDVIISPYRIAREQ